MLSRRIQGVLSIGVLALAGCATTPDTAPNVVWVAEFSSSKFGPVSNAFTDPRDCAAWQERYRGTECLRAHLGGGADRWLFPVTVAEGGPPNQYFGSFDRNTCEAMATSFPRGGMQAAGECQPYKVTP